MTGMNESLVDNEFTQPTKSYEMSILVQQSNDADLRDRLLRLVQHVCFRLLTMILIITDCALTFADLFTENKQENDQLVYNWFALIFGFIFLVELFVRLYATGMDHFFLDYYNCIDFIVILLSFIVTVVYVFIQSNAYMRLIKIGRIVRVIVLLRLLRIFLTEPNNIKKGVRHVVSENKRRYRGEGFDLDLTYITPRVIGMSFPSTGMWALYRNNIKDVARFFDQKHGEGHYRIYNLCSEKSYDTSFFHDSVKRFPIDDHNVPTIQQMFDFVNDVKDFLAADDENVIAVHCKGGKGRTGTMICAWLIFNGHFKDTKEVLDYFGDRRTDTSVGKKYQGVETPSQARYIEYFTRVINLMDSKIPDKRQLSIKSIVIDGINTVGLGDGSDLQCSILIDRQETFNLDFSVSKNCKVFHNAIEDMLIITPVNCPPLAGDVRIKFNCSTNIVPRAYEDCAFYFWFNTGFIEDDDKTLIINRDNLDNPHKSKTWKIYRDKFKVTVNFS